VVVFNLRHLYLTILVLRGGVGLFVRHLLVEGELLNVAGYLRVKRLGESLFHHGILRIPKIHLPGKRREKRRTGGAR
jgi:hypothetical protein